MKPAISTERTALGSLILSVAAFGLALPMMLTGCDREVSHESTSKVRSDGSSKTEEKTVKESPDGTVKIEKSTQNTPPTKP